MIKEVTISKYFCDICGKGAEQWNSCDNCGKSICYDCQPSRMKRYAHAVSASGSGDGQYCVECDAMLTTNGDKRHAAYRLIQSLRNESKGFYDDFKSRADAAEKAIKEINRP